MVAIKTRARVDTITYRAFVAGAMRGYEAAQIGMSKSQMLKGIQEVWHEGS